MKKTFLSALVLIALTAQFTGCNGNTPSEQPNESSSVVLDVSEPQNSTSSSETESSSKPQSSTVSTTSSTSETNEPQSGSTETTTSVPEVSEPQSSTVSTTSSSSETSKPQNSAATTTSSVPEVNEPQSSMFSTTSSEPVKPPVTYAPETDFGCAFVNDGVEIRTYEGAGGNVVIPETINGDPVVMISGRVTNHEGFVGAFKNNTAVTSITIPDTVMGFGGVDGCTNLESINVGEGNPYLASIDGMLYRKTENGLMLILCPEGKKGKAVIPDSVTEIAEGAFSGCNGITEIVVGNGVTKVNKDILGGCVNLKHLTLGNGIITFGRPSYLIADMGDTLEDFASLESVVFGDGLTRLGDCSFDGCTSLKSVTLGNGLTSISDYAFKGCSNVTVTYKGKTYTQSNIEDLYNLFN